MTDNEINRLVDFLIRNGWVDELPKTREVLAGELQEHFKEAQNDTGNLT